MISQFLVYPLALPAPANDNWDWADRRRTLTFLCHLYHTNKRLTRSPLSGERQAWLAGWLRRQLAAIRQHWAEIAGPGEV